MSKCGESKHKPGDVVEIDLEKMPLKYGMVDGLTINTSMVDLARRSGKLTLTLRAKVNQGDGDFPRWTVHEDGWTWTEALFVHRDAYHPQAGDIIQARGSGGQPKYRKVLAAVDQMVAVSSWKTTLETAQKAGYGEWCSLMGLKTNLDRETGVVTMAAAKKTERISVAEWQAESGYVSEVEGNCNDCHYSYGDPFCAKAGMATGEEVKVSDEGWCRFYTDEF